MIQQPDLSCSRGCSPTWPPLFCSPTPPWPDLAPPSPLPHHMLPPAPLPLSPLPLRCVLFFVVHLQLHEREQRGYNPKPGP